MKNKIYKFTVSKPEYSSLLESELDAIRMLIGDFDIIKIKQPWYLVTSMVIYCVKKG